jgi:uncharacterized protein (UPF0335 family)
MAKEEIKKLLESSKERLEQDHATFAQTIKEELKTFKKKTLDKI